MSALAREKYRITVLPTHLPSQTLEQGVDIIMLIRNINTYTSKYMYNLHMQTFVQLTPETKQIKSVGVRQVHHSLKTHGVGILSTAINHIYKFLMKQYEKFSEFLNDDMINSPLLIEAKWFRTNKESVTQRYPFERADKIAKVIKNLGVLEGGATVLDKFRLLITKVGNTLGYVRMIRNASIKDSSDLFKFMPKHIDKLKLEEELAENQVEGEPMECGKMFDRAVGLLFEQEKDATDYLRLLVSIFDGILTGEENKHMRNFYMTIPALTLNYVEWILPAKERVKKKNQTNACISVSPAPHPPGRRLRSRARLHAQDPRAGGPLPLAQLVREHRGEAKARRAEHREGAQEEAPRRGLQQGALLQPRCQPAPRVPDAELLLQRGIHLLPGHLTNLLTNYPESI